MCARNFSRVISCSPPAAPTPLPGGLEDCPGVAGLLRAPADGAGAAHLNPSGDADGAELVAAACDRVDAVVHAHAALLKLRTWLPRPRARPAPEVLVPVLTKIQIHLQLLQSGQHKPVEVLQ